MSNEEEADLEAAPDEAPEEDPEPIPGEDEDLHSHHEDEICQSWFPSRFPGVAKFVSNNPNFEWIMFFIISLNCIHVGTSCQCNRKCTVALQATLDNLDYIFNGFFVVEWILRVLCDPYEYFHCFVNSIDSFTVWVAGVGASLVHVLGMRFNLLGFITPEFLMSLRLLRSARLLNMTCVMRSIPALKEMWLLLVGVRASMSTLVPSLGLILGVVFIHTVFAVEFIGRNSHWSDANLEKYVRLGDLDEDSIEWPQKFRQLTPALFTVSRFMGCDNSGDIVDVLMYKQGYSVVIFFMMFTAIAAYVLLNLVTAVICNNAMEITKSDAQNHAKEVAERRKQEMRDLYILFTSLDDDGSGEVSTAEFNQAFEEPEVANKLLCLGYEEDELKQLFQLLDSDGTGLVDAKEFCGGMSKLKGHAQARDMLTMLKSTEKTEKRLRKILQAVFPDVSPCHLTRIDKLEHPVGIWPLCLHQKRLGRGNYHCDCKQFRRDYLAQLRVFDNRVALIEDNVSRIKNALGNLRQLRRDIREKRKGVTMKDAGNAVIAGNRMAHAKDAQEEVQAAPKAKAKGKSKAKSKAAAKKK